MVHMVKSLTHQPFRSLRTWPLYKAPPHGRALSFCRCSFDVSSSPYEQCQNAETAGGGVASQHVASTSTVLLTNEDVTFVVGESVHRFRRARNTALI